MCACSLHREEMSPECTIGRRQIIGGSVTLGAMFCWEASGPGIHVDFNLIATTDQNIAADQIHSFIATVFWDHCVCVSIQSNFMCVYVLLSPRRFSDGCLGIVLNHHFCQSISHLADFVGVAGKEQSTAEYSQHGGVLDDTSSRVSSDY